MQGQDPQMEHHWPPNTLDTWSYWLFPKWMRQWTSKARSTRQIKPRHHPPHFSPQQTPLLQYPSTPPGTPIYNTQKLEKKMMENLTLLPPHSINKYLSHHHSSIIIQLRMGHSLLNQHLFRIFHSETPTCPHCPGLTPETVCHFLLICPYYQNECHLLCQKPKCKAESIPFLFEPHQNQQAQCYTQQWPEH